MARAETLQVSWWTLPWDRGARNKESRRTAALSQKMEGIADLQPWSGQEISYSSLTLPDLLLKHGPNVPLLQRALNLERLIVRGLPLEVRVNTATRGSRRLSLHGESQDALAQFSFDKNFNITGIDLSDAAATRGRIDVDPKQDSGLIDNLLGVLNNDLASARLNWSVDLAGKARVCATMLDREVHPIATMAVGALIEAVRQAAPEERFEVYALKEVLKGDGVPVVVQLIMPQQYLGSFRRYNNQMLAGFKHSVFARAVTETDVRSYIDVEANWIVDISDSRVPMTVIDRDNPSAGFTVSLRREGVDGYQGRKLIFSDPRLMEHDFDNYLRGENRGQWSSSLNDTIKEPLVLLWSQGNRYNPISNLAQVGFR